MLISTQIKALLSSTFLTRFCVLSSAMLFSACATVAELEPSEPPTPDPQIVPAPTASVVDRTIALDIVRAASQVYAPFNTTMQFNNKLNDPLLDYFISLFTEAGYGIQRVSADQGSNYFSYTRVEDRTADDEPLIRFDTSIGAVKVGRDYTVPAVNTVSPASPVRLSGTLAPVKVKDAPNGRFVVSDADFSSAIYVASLGIEERTPAPVISLITDDLVSQVASRDIERTTLQGLNSNSVEIVNVFHTGESNFSSILDSYEQVSRQIVVFGDDSLVLGDTNKLLIEKFVKQRVKPNDLISLLGCSNGPTALEIGNEGLALGRAKRMTQALISQGVARDKILEEGCWAPLSAGNDIPSRGVVLELWRKA